MILTKKKMYPKTDMLNISNIKKGGFHMKKNRKIFSILLVLVLAIQLTAFPQQQRPHVQFQEPRLR